MSRPRIARRIHAGSALLLIAVVLCAGCKVDARVDVTLRADGSGTVTARVTLDADAARRLTAHAPLDQAVPLDDVRAAGWQVSGWKSSAGGSTITLSHAFAGQADLARRLADLVGSTGVLRDARITRTHGWLESKDGIGVTGDLRHLSIGIRSDAELSRSLANAGIDVNALDTRLRSELGNAFSLTLAVHAPDGESKSVTLRAGDQERAGASNSHRHTARVLLVVIGVALLGLALLLTAASVVATSRRRRGSSASGRR